MRKTQRGSGNFEKFARVARIARRTGGRRRKGQRMCRWKRSSTASGVSGSSGTDSRQRRGLLWHETRLPRENTIEPGHNVALRRQTVGAFLIVACISSLAECYPRYLAQRSVASHAIVCRRRILFEHRFVKWWRATSANCPEIVRDPRFRPFGRYSPRESGKKASGSTTAWRNGRKDEFLMELDCNIYIFLFITIFPNVIA